MNRIIKNSEKNKVLRYLCLTSEILEGKSKSFSISDEKGLKEDIALFNIHGNYYAISDTCAHKGGPLSQGILEEDVVTCPWHGWKYNVRTGKSPHKGGDSVNGFVTKVIGNKTLHCSYSVKARQESLHSSQEIQKFTKFGKKSSNTNGQRLPVSL